MEKKRYFNENGWEIVEVSGDWYDSFMYAYDRVEKGAVPEGLFFLHTDLGQYVGIRSSAAEGLVRKWFDMQEECLKWLGCSAAFDEES